MLIDLKGTGGLIVGVPLTSVRILPQPVDGVLLVLLRPARVVPPTDDIPGSTDGRPNEEHRGEHDDDELPHPSHGLWPPLVAANFGEHRVSDAHDRQESARTSVRDPGFGSCLSVPGPNAPQPRLTSTRAKRAPSAGIGVPLSSTSTGQGPCPMRGRTRTWNTWSPGGKSARATVKYTGIGDPSLVTRSFIDGVGLM